MEFGMLIENSETRVEIGEVILVDGRMAYLRDFDYYKGKVEYENGETRWVVRQRIAAIV